MWMDIISLGSTAFMSQLELLSEEHIKVCPSLSISFFILFWFEIFSGGGYYTLRDVIFYLENANLQISEYRAKVNAAGVTAIVVQDSPHLMQYLTGQIDTCEQIDQSIINSGPSEPVTVNYGTDNTHLSEETLREQRSKFVDCLQRFVQQTNLLR